MSTETIRPDGTLVNNWSLTGGATLHEVLADDSDASYASYSGDDQAQSIVTFEAASLPAGAVTVRCSLRARAGRPSVSGGYGAIKPWAVLRTTEQPEVIVHWSDATTVAISGGALASMPDDRLAHLGIRTLAGDTVRLFELLLDVIYAAVPEVTVDAPTGTLDESNRPLVEWTPALDTDGGSQRFYEVKVFTDAQYGAGGFDPDTSDPTDESGIVASSSRSWRGEVSLPNDTLRAYVRVAQEVNGEKHWSEWAYSEFTVDVPLPGTPTIEVTADSVNARIAIDLTDTAGEVSSDLMQVQRSLDGGGTWENIRGTRDAP